MEENTRFPRKVVIDASVVLNFLMPDEKNFVGVDSLFEKLKSQEIVAYAPTILSYEVANGLRSAVLSKRANKTDAIKIYKDFSNLGIYVSEVENSESLKLAINKGLSVYDASYAYLANLLEIHLCTSDKNMSEATKKSIYLNKKNK